jgi:hypothetical protein
MMATGVKAGEAYVEIGVDQKKLERGLAGLKTKLNHLGARLVKAGAVLASAGAALGAGIIVATNKWADAGDAIAKMSKRTGIGVESLSRLKHAADLSGTSMGGLENGIRRMQRSLLDASQGTKTAVDALAMLGLSYRDLKNLSPEQQFMTITARLADVADPTMKAALAMELFGRSGTALLPMLTQGSAGLQDMMDKTRMVFTPEKAALAERYNDAITSLKDAIQGLVAQIAPIVASGLIPKIESAVKAFDNLGLNVKKVAWQIAEAFLKMINGIGVWLKRAAIFWGGVIMQGCMQMAKGPLVLKTFFLNAFEGIAAGFKNTIGWVVEKWATAMRAMGLMSDETFNNIKLRMSDTTRTDYSGQIEKDLKRVDEKIARIGEKTRQSMAEAESGWFAGTIAQARAEIGRIDNQLRKANAAAKKQPGGPLSLGGAAGIPAAMASAATAAPQFRATGTVGFWGGQSMGEQMGAIGRGADVQKEQLNVQKTMADKLDKIERNTGGDLAPAWG